MLGRIFNSDIEYWLWCSLVLLSPPRKTPEKASDEATTFSFVEILSSSSHSSFNSHPAFPVHHIHHLPAISPSQFIIFIIYQSSRLSSSSYSSFTSHPAIPVHHIHHLPVIPPFQFIIFIIYQPSQFIIFIIYQPSRHSTIQCCPKLTTVKNKPLQILVYSRWGRL